MSENKKHDGNYKSSTAMEAANQDMEFVNDTLAQTKNTTNQIGAITKKKD